MCSLVENIDRTSGKVILEETNPSEVPKGTYELEIEGYIVGYPDQKETHKFIINFTDLDLGACSVDISETNFDFYIKELNKLPLVL